MNCTGKTGQWKVEGKWLKKLIKPPRASFAGLSSKTPAGTECIQRLAYTPDITSTSFDLMEKRWLCLQGILRVAA